VAQPSPLEVNTSLQAESADLPAMNWCQGAQLMYPRTHSEAGTENDPGPGVLIILVPMGARQTKEVICVSLVPYNRV